MREVHQPHAAEDCSAQCSGKSGWCNFCGGKNTGACCKAGDGGVCKAFDVPVGWNNGVYQNCVHTGCIQSNTGYHGAELKKMPKDVVLSPEECQVQCAAVDGAVAFRSKDSKGEECVCLGKDGLTRHQEVGAFSGKTKCESEETLIQIEAKLEKNVTEITKVPMEETDPCEKSPVVYNYAEVEEKHGEWINTCYQKAAAVMTKEFNIFNERFAKFVDTLTWKAGCAAQHEVDLSVTGAGNGYMAVSKDFDGGSFSSCNWNRQEKNDEDMWIFDDSRARGWTGTSRINMQEQATAKLEYPMPSWLHDLKHVRQCLKNTAAGMAEDANNDQSAAVGTIVDPVSSTVV